MPDFSGAFWFYAQEALQTWGGRSVSVEVREVGTLTLTSGKIVACDGLIPSDEPFTQTVTPGSYPVVLCLVSGDKGWPIIACAMLRFKDEMPRTWKLATVAGQSEVPDRKGEIVGYGVDTGDGCFADLDAMRELISLQEPYERFRDAVTKSRSDWFDYNLDVEPPTNIITFSSGEGDGTYPSYFGYDADGDALCLATDFGIIAPLPETHTEAPSKYQLRLDL